MTPLAIPPLVAFAILLIVWSYVLGQRKGDALNRAFLLATGWAGGWLGTHLLIYIPDVWPVKEAIFAVQSIFWIPSGLLFLNFAYILTGRKRDLFFKLGFVVTVSCALLHLIKPDLFISRYVQTGWGIIQLYETPVGKTLYTLFSSLTAFYGAAGLVLIFWKRRKTTSRREMKTMGLIIQGGVVTIVASFGANVVLPIFSGLPLTPKYGSSMSVVFIVMVFRAVNKYQFLSPSVENVANELFEDINDGVLLIDDTNNVIRANKAVQRMLGTTNIASTLSAVLPGIDTDAETAEQSIAATTPNGTRALAVSISTIATSGISTGRIVIVRDVTAQKEAEAVLKRSRDELEREVAARTAELRHAQRMEAIGTFTGAIAHDFNNLLSAILGFAHTAQREVQKSSPAHPDLSEIITAGRRAKDIIRKLMTFSRQEQDVPFRSVRIKDVLREVVDLAQVSLPRNIATRYDIDECDAAILCDPAQLTQLLMNLLANAVYALKGIPNGALSITTEVQNVNAALARLTPPLAPGEHVKIVVSDTGHGMSKEIVERIFDPFFTTKPKGEGTGLGLSTALGVVRNHGGAMTVESKPNEGTRFTIYLPTTDAPTRISDVDTNDVAGGKEHILLVDDEQQLGRLIVRLLSPLGYRITVSTSSTAALRMVTDNPKTFDLALLDHIMPELTGVQLAKAILEHAPGMPIILMSGYEGELDPAELKAIGIRKMLQKPIPLGKLASTLRSVLDS